MWPFNQSVASSALSVIIDFRRMLLAVVFNTQILYGIQMYSLYSLCVFFVIFRYGNTKILYETNLWNPWSEYSKRWLLVLLVFVSLSFMEWRFYSVYSFSISKSEYILLMNFTNTHNNRLIHYSLSLYTTCSTQKTMNVYNKINKQSSTHLICLSLCLCLCVCVWAWVCLRCVLHTFIWLLRIIYFAGVLSTLKSNIEQREQSLQIASIYFCAFWADAFRILCDVNIYIQFNSFRLLLLHTLILFLPLFYFFPFTNLLSAFCTIFCIMISYGLFSSFLFFSNRQ